MFQYSIDTPPKKYHAQTTDLTNFARLVCIKIWLLKAIYHKKCKEILAYLGL